MAFPGFRKRRPAASSTATDHVANDDAFQSSGESNKKLATKTRRNAILVTCFCYFVAVVFLILVEIGSTSGSKVLGDIYFFKLDVSDITLQSASAGLTLMNSIARTLGLHDFYQVGLWNFCEGYSDEGITFCSTPTTLYWFNPVEIITGELFAGASIALPSEVGQILTILRIASQVMFGFFLAGLLLDFVLIFLAPIVLYSRWWSLPFTILAFIAALMITAATIVGTVMSLIFKYALTSQSDLNIGVGIGVKMWAFMWIATAFTLLAFFIHAGMCCCCTSRRDLRTGRKGGKGFVESPGSSEKTKGGLKLPKFSKQSGVSR